MLCYANYNGGMIMNKTNKNLNLALRILIILSWIMSNVSLFMMITGVKNINTDGLDKDNVGERLLDVVSDFAKNTTFYYVVLGMTACCLVLAIVTRYKTKMVSYVFKIIALVITVLSQIAGITYIGALGELKNVTVKFSGTSKDAIVAGLKEAGVSGDVDSIAATLLNNNEAAATLGAYMLTIIVLFILMITSIHCLVKREDPNNIENSGEQQQY